MSIIVRIAPSPTGYMHIGTARTALFNYYFAKRMGGKFLLRIEDTDRERSTPEAVNAIISGMKWLGLDWDGEPIMQFARASRHAEIAHELVKRGAAYYCYMTAAEIEAERAAAESNGQMWHYDRRWRDRAPEDAPEGVAPSIRIKAPLGDGALTLHDVAQGDVTVNYAQLDDFILLRSDGTPTYMLAVVVDDHDMGVTHVIRGDDHLNNMFRQYVIYQGMGWDFPVHAHVPLIHGTDGKKLSKRKGAAAIEEFRDMGYLPQALRNYLLRLGWSHGDDEIITDQQATAWFDLEHIGQSPSQLDFDKLDSVNHHYILLSDNNNLIDLIKPKIEEKLGGLSPAQHATLLAAMPALKERCKTLITMENMALLYLYPADQLPMDHGAQEKLAQPHMADVLAAAMACLPAGDDIDGAAFIAAVLEQSGLKMGQVAPVLRAALTGTMQSPDLGPFITALGRAAILARLQRLV